MYLNNSFIIVGEVNFVNMYYIIVIKFCIFLFDFLNNKIMYYIFVKLKREENSLEDSINKND